MRYVVNTYIKEICADRRSSIIVRLNARHLSQSVQDMRMLALLRKYVQQLVLKQVELLSMGTHTFK